MAASRLAAVLLCGVVIACSTSTPSPTPGATATQPPSMTPTPATTAASTDAPTPSPSPAATPSSKPTPKPAGLAWEAVALPAALGITEPHSIVAGDAGFLFLGYGDDGGLVSLISADGLNWSPLDAGDFQGADRVASWDGRYLRAGTVGDGSELRAAFWVSDDGRTWEPLPSPATLAFFPDGAPASVGAAYVWHHEAAGNRIEALGFVGKRGGHFGDRPLALVRWVSEDGGLTWSRRELKAEFSNLFAPVRIGDLWARISPDGTSLQTSIDLERWQSATDPEGYVEWSRVRLTPFGAVAVGWLEVVDMPPYGLVVNSTDGVTWIRSTGSPALEGALLYDAAGTASALVAIGQVVNYAPNPQAPAQVWISHGTAD